MLDVLYSCKGGKQIEGNAPGLDPRDPGAVAGYPIEVFCYIADRPQANVWIDSYMGRITFFRRKFVFIVDNNSIIRFCMTHAVVKEFLF
jgi:hypothetical protein